MSSHTLLIYIFAWLLVAVTPGPAVICAMSQAVRFGMRPAFAGIVGIHLGHLVLFSATATGLAALLATAATAFTFLRWAGAAYLLYLGARIVLTSFRKTPEPQATASIPQRRNLLLQGLAIQVTNPKALLFMSALLPQFLHPEAPLAPQLVILGVATIVIDVTVLSSYAWLAIRGTRSQHLAGVQRWLERAFGASLVFFGIRLLSPRP